MDVPDAIDVARRYTAQITYTITELSDPRLQELKARGKVYSFPMGTGFLVSGQGHVVTAAHVLDDIKALAARVPEGNHFVGVGLAHGGTAPGRLRILKYDVVATDVRDDLALLKLRDNPFQMSRDQLETAVGGDPVELEVASFRVGDPRDGEAIAVSGYPLDEPVLVSTSGVVASASSKDIKGTLLPDAGDGYLPADISDRYLGDVQVNPGNSGGPGYLVEDASVIGMVQSSKLRGPVMGGGPQQSSDLAVLIPSKTIVKFVSTNCDASLRLT